MAITKLKIAKAVIQGAILVGTNAIVGDVIKNNTDPDGALDAVTYTAGRYAISSMIALRITQHTDAWFDKLTEMSEEAKPKETKAEPEGSVTLVENNKVV